METSNPVPSVAPENKKKHPAFIRWAFVFGIAIIANLFVYYVVQAFHPEPLWNDFCSEELSMRIVETPEACQAIKGMWQADQMKTSPAGGYCDVTYECRQKYEAALKVYERDVFLVFVVLGTVLLLASTFLTLVDVVALGLSVGGVLSLIIGSTRYWSNMEEWLRVIVLGIALASLVYFAWKKFKSE